MMSRSWVSINWESLLNMVVSALSMEEVKVSNTAMIKEYLKWEKYWSSLTHFVLQSVIGWSEVSLKSMKIFLSDISKVVWSLITANNLCILFPTQSFVIFTFGRSIPLTLKRVLNANVCVLMETYIIDIYKNWSDPSDPFKHTSSGFSVLYTQPD